MSDRPHGDVALLYKKDGTLSVCRSIGDKAYDLAGKKQIDAVFVVYGECGVKMYEEAGDERV